MRLARRVRPLRSCPCIHLSPLSCVSIPRRFVHPNQVTPLQWAEPHFADRDVFIYPLGAGGRHIVLNRPSSLNALNLSMVRQFTDILDALDRDKDIGLVIMSGAGSKAFCAGGDVRVLHDAGLIRKEKKNQTGSHDLTREFFRAEYTLNFKLSYLSFPLVAVMNGITMGGGVGLSCHLRYRCATPSSLFAMPECAIGFFPDVGSSYLLNRLHFPYLGYYLGLTGARLKGYDLVHAGIATHYYVGDDYPQLVKLAYSQNGNTWQQGEDAVENIFWHMSKIQRETPPAFTISQQQLDIIEKCFGKPTIEQIIEALEQQQGENQKELQSPSASVSTAAKSTAAFLSSTLSSFSSASPLSLKVTLELLKAGRLLDLPGCLSMEYRASQRFMLGNDFYSGVNSMLISKDKQPKWKHKSVADVTDDEVKQYLAPLTDEPELILEYPTVKEPQWYI